MKTQTQTYKRILKEAEKTLNNKLEKARIKVINDNPHLLEIIRVAKRNII